MSRKQIICLALLLLVVFCLPYDMHAQCAMCRASVKSNLLADGRHIGAGLNQGILYLMAMPYLLFTVIAYSWYKSSKKNQLRKKYQINIEN